ncbi:MAG: PIN domain-containing protein [Gaiellaceae bacterium]
MILLDSSGLLAALNPDQPQHEAARAALAAESAPLILSPFVLAELDYLIATRGSVEAELAFLGEVAAGAYEIAAFDSDDVRAAAAVITRYHDLEIGIADASLVVLAARYKTERILTLDERHFRALRSPQGKAFMLLPADSRG